MKYTVLLTTMALIAFAGCVKSYGQTNPDCKIRVEGGKYQWKGVSQVKTESAFFGYVLVKPKEINREFLFRLARRLKREYCEAERLQVVIFDQKKYANPLSQADHIDSGGKTFLMRGFYSFDRTQGTDLLEFSSKPGNPTTENMFDLTKIRE